MSDIRIELLIFNNPVVNISWSDCVITFNLVFWNVVRTSLNVIFEKYQRTELFYPNFIHCNRTIHFYWNYFFADSECPKMEDPKTEFGKSQINSWLVFPFLKWVFVSNWPITNLFGATEIPFDGPPFGGTQKPREINFYRNELFCYGVNFRFFIHFQSWQQNILFRTEIRKNKHFESGIKKIWNVGREISS